MDYYLLSRWEAIELFCEVISKAGEREMNDFVGSNKYIDYYVERLSTDHASVEFSKKNFQSTFPNVMRVLSDNINRGIPFTLSERQLKFIIGYIEKGIEAEKIRFNLKGYSIYNKRHSDEKQRIFEKTYWWFYFHNQLTDKVKSDVIVKAVLLMLPFGRTKIIRPLLPDEKSTDSVQTYVGTYSIHGKNGDQLKLSYKTEKNDRDNDLLIYIGDKVHPISIGIYNANFRYMHCGPAYIERIVDPSVIKQIEEGNEKGLASFKLSADSDFDEAQKIVMEFLSKGGNVDVPKGINNSDELSEWLKRNK